MSQCRMSRTKLTRIRVKVRVEVSFRVRELGSALVGPIKLVFEFGISIAFFIFSAWGGAGEIIVPWERARGAPK